MEEIFRGEILPTLLNENYMCSRLAYTLLEALYSKVHESPNTPSSATDMAPTTSTTANFTNSKHSWAGHKCSKDDSSKTGANFKSLPW